MVIYNEDGLSITFAYKISYLLDVIVTESVYKSKALENVLKDNVRYDEITVGDVDHNRIIKDLKRAATNVYAKMANYGHNVENAFIFNMDYQFPGEDKPVPAILITIVPATNWDHNLKDQLDTLIEETFVSGTMYGWYRRMQQVEAAMTYREDEKDNLDQIKVKLEHRRIYPKKVYRDY